MKKFFTIIFFTAMLVIMLPTVYVAADYYGDWEYNDATYGVEIISYIGSGGDVSIPNLLGGSVVERIGEKVFFNNKNITSVSIPEGVVSIGKNAFTGCSNLQSVSIPQSVRTISEQAFSIKNSVPGDSSTAALISIIVDGNNSIYASDDGVLYDKNKSKLIQFPAGKGGNFIVPNTVIEISDDAFLGCSKISEITLQNGIKTIGNYAFAASGLEKITIPDSVESVNTQAFGYTPNLSVITIPGSIKTFGSMIFSNSGITAVTVNDGVTAIGDSMFSGCRKLTSVTMPNSITSIGNSAFSSCSGLTAITIPGSVTSIGSSAFSSCSSLTAIAIPGSVTSIGSSAFSSCSSLTAITIPESIKILNSNIFNNCTSLGEAIIGNGVQSIGNSAFESCRNLKTIIIPTSVLSIGDSAFNNCVSLPSITIPTSVTDIGNSAFGNCISLTTITIPSSVKSIGRTISAGCTKLESFTVVPENQYYLSDDQGILYSKAKTKLLEYPYGKKTSFVIPDNVTIIGDYAFNNIPSLNSINIPDSVTLIGNNAFSSCTSLNEVILGNSVVTIGQSAFNNCNKLTSVTIPNSVTSVGNNAFSGCISLNEVILGNGVVTIGQSAFNNCNKLTSIDIPLSVTSIGIAAFSNCQNLTSITIPSSVTTIGRNISYGCPKVTAITVDADNQNFSSDDQGILYDKNKTALLEYPYGKTDEFTIPENVTAINTYAFNNISALTSINIPRNLKQMNANAFYSCQNLTSITFSNPSTTINTSAFNLCSKLTTICGYPGSTAETFAKFTSKTFILMGDPVTLVIRKDGIPINEISVSNELLGDTRRTDENGLVYFPITGYDTETVYNHVIDIEDNIYKYPLKGSQIAIVDFRTLKVRVYNGGNLVKGASVSINTQTIPYVDTDDSGIAEFLLLNNAETHEITVEYEGEVGQISMTADSIDNGYYTIHMDSNQVKRKTITGSVKHNGNGISGIVITAQKDGETPLYASTKADGSYRFIVPHDSEGTYVLNVIEDGGYDNGILPNSQLSAEPGDSGRDFTFEDGLTLKGTVTNTAGEPLPAKEISDAGELSPTVKLYLEKDNKIWAVETAPGGGYQFNALYPGTYKLSYGISNYIYTRNETIDLSEDTIKDITLAKYSASSPRNIKYDISVKSPVEHGEWGTVSIRCQNMDNEKYENLILEVEIPEGVIIDTDKLGDGQLYEDDKLYTTVDLDRAGAFGEADFVTLRFMYRLENGYDKDKVVFTAFAREQQAVSDPLKEYEIPSFHWSRTDESKTEIRNTFSWKWSDLGGLSLDITDTEKVWDGQYERYYDNYGTGADTSKEYATWKFKGNPDKNESEYRRFRTEFTKPNKDYAFSHILSENYAAYASSGAVFPINDEIFMFVYPKGMEVTDENASQYLAFWGSTQFGAYSGGEFMGVKGNKAIRYSDVIPALKHSDYWFLDGTQNRIKEILDGNPESSEFIIDVFTSDIAEGGGMDKFNLVFTNTEIPQIPSEGGETTIPYMDFIGMAHANIFKPSLTGDETVTALFVRGNEYKLKGQSMKDSEVRIFRLDTGNLVASFHTDGYYKDIGTLLPPVAGTYPYIAECTKEGSVQISNIHVVEVLDDSKLSNIQLTSATLHGQTQSGKNPFIPINVWVGTTVSVSATFEGVEEGDKILYKLAGINQSFRADDLHKAGFPPATSGTKDVSVIVVRNDTIVFHKIIGRIYASIDPSGYVYDKHTQKRIEGATVTCYILNGTKWEVWKAENHGQTNPLITDSNGRYAWDVPEGTYKVTVEKEGYAAYDTINDPKYSFTEGIDSSIIIPPPRLDINMGIENISKPFVESSYPANGDTISVDDVIFCEFNKAMDEGTLNTDNITLKMGSKSILASIKINKTKNVVSIIPKESLVPGNYTLGFGAAIQDYSKDKNLDETIIDFMVLGGIPATMEAFKANLQTAEIGIHDGIVITFNHAVGSIEAEDVTLLTEDGQALDISLSLSKDKKSLTVYPADVPAPLSTYTLTLSEHLESADGLILQGDSFTIKMLDQVKAPTADPENGYIAKGSKVILSCGTEGSEIRYTIDNSVPTALSTKYTDPITISSNTTIKAIAINTGMADSEIMVFEYIVLPAAGTPVADLPEGEVLSGTKVTLSCATDGAVIRYTLDGTEPDRDSDEYIAPITITEATIIKAIAFKDGLLNSGMATFEYTIKQVNDEVTVSYIAGTGGRIEGTATQKISRGGTTIAVTAVPKPGYAFVKWDDGKASTTRYEKNVQQDKTIRAEFKKTTTIDKFHTVSLNPNGGTVSRKKIEVKAGMAIGTLPKPTKKGYAFKGWYTSIIGGTKITAAYKVTYSVTIFAQWDVTLPKKGSIFSHNNLKYKVMKQASAKTAGSVQVQGTTKKTARLSIPATVRIGKYTYKVETIAKNAFKNNSKLKTLAIGNNVKEIQDNAFYGCKELAKVTLGKNVAKIGSKVFYNDKKLKSITIQSMKLKTIGKQALKNIHKNAKIKVPSSRLKLYKNLLKGKGLSKSVVIGK